VLVIDDSRALVRFSEEGAELVFVPPQEAPQGVRFLLGEDPAGVVYFGVLGPLPEMAAEEEGGRAAGSGAGPAVRPASLREAGQLLGDRDAGPHDARGCAGQLHSVSTHCSLCGAVTSQPTRDIRGHCPVDSSEHFPRLDPAVIMLVTDPADRCLLARNSAGRSGACRSWPVSSSQVNPRSRLSRARSWKRRASGSARYGTSPASHGPCRTA